LESYDTKDKEVLALWHNTESLFQESKRDLLRAIKARKKPYFGRIDFKDAGLSEPESYYVGRVGISPDGVEQLVIDWRAPMASVYYENALGTCYYEVKDTVENETKVHEIDLFRKRTYEIENDTLVDFYDSDIVANDELLTKCLAKSKKAVLGEIIGTFEDEYFEVRKIAPSLPGGRSVEKIQVVHAEGGEAHGGGDQAVIRDFIALVRGEETSPCCTTLQDSVVGHRIVFMAEQSREKGGQMIQY